MNKPAEGPNDPVASTVRPEIRAMAAYPVADATGLIKLDLMENPFQLPQALREKLGRRLADIHLNRYPDPRPDALLAALRPAAEIPDGAGVLLGNGSDELINIIACACGRDGGGLLAPVPTFVMYQHAARLFGLPFTAVPLTPGFELDRDALLAALSAARPAVVFLSYPNNPTGNLFDRSDIEAILDAAPGMVIVDEAYRPFAPDTFMNAVGRHPRLAVLRTLSKSGLAGARFGYLAGPPAWIAELDKIRPPFNVNVMTQCCVSFALEHKAVLDAQAALLRGNRETLARALAALPGITVFASAANFLLFRVASQDPRAASAVFEGIKRRGVLIKDVSHGHPLLANCLRVTVSSDEENAAFLVALKASLPGAPS